jgi:hypothetical protein
LLPRIPEKLWKIDSSTVGEHFSLRESDQCYYIWEYTAGRDFKFSPSNHLIFNLKIKPGHIRKSPNRAFYKEQAIDHSAAALRKCLTRDYVEQAATFIPIPGSKAPGDPEYDDRMLKVLTRAFEGWAVDIRPILKLTESTAADHESEERLPYEQLLAISKLEDSAQTLLKPLAIVVDDVLNSGKHFRVAQALIAKQFPTVSVRGLFLARCIHERH